MVEVDSLKHTMQVLSPSSRGDNLTQATQINSKFIHTLLVAFTPVLGRVVYDFVSGYYRMDTWPTRELNPGIDGVSIWDFRELPPVVTTIDDTMTCYTQKMDPKLSPKPEDYSKYLFSGFKFWNRALAEEWTDGGGGMLYTDGSFRFISLSSAGLSLFLSPPLSCLTSRS